MFTHCSVRSNNLKVMYCINVSTFVVDMVTIPWYMGGKVRGKCTGEMSREKCPGEMSGGECPVECPGGNVPEVTCYRMVNIV